MQLEVVGATNGKTDSEDPNQDLSERCWKASRQDVSIGGVPVLLLRAE